MKTSITSRIPPLRLERLNDAPVNADGRYVLYWMIASRRAHWNFALDRALEWARQLDRPLVVFEPLRAAYPWASDRLHRFVIEGMRDNAARFADSPVYYYPYVEPRIDADKGLLAALGKHAAAIVTDDYPCFFLPRMVRSAAKKMPVPVEAVDSNGLLPWRATDRVFPTAYAFRRFLQQQLPDHLADVPQSRPLARLKLPRLAALPDGIAKKWPALNARQLSVDAAWLARLPLDHAVGAAAFAGGSVAAEHALRRFLPARLEDYLEDRNEPEQDATSGLSPYLHFGHVSAHQVFHAVMRGERWSPDKLAAGAIGKKTATGKRTGWWGVGPAAEAFLDQLITWRELGFNMAALEPKYDQYESLPDWARQTLGKHARDRRAPLYSPAQLERAETYDPLWNAAQRQLVVEGRLHNYLRMLWGKKILEWTRSPEQALDVMIDLNNKYAVDGRDPNSYSGIFWVLGRYDRPWGPERPIFGKIRYMSSENTARKFAVRGYIEKYAPQPGSKD